MFFKEKNYNEKGFVILFAVLISAIILLIGAGILGISVKESILSSSARESQYAINAADAGLECVMYDDIGIGGNLNQGSLFVDCAENLQPINLTSVSVMMFKFDNPNGGPELCAHVERTPSIPTNTNYDPGLYELITVISQGFNLCNGTTPLVNDPLFAERVLRITYYKPKSI